MRRLSLLFIPFLALASCSPELEGPARPIAREQVGAGLGVDVVAARQTVVDFLDAYAHATEDEGGRLAELVRLQAERARASGHKPGEMVEGAEGLSRCRAWQR